MSIEYYMNNPSFLHWKNLCYTDIFTFYFCTRKNHLYFTHTTMNDWFNCISASYKNNRSKKDFPTQFSHTREIYCADCVITHTHEVFQAKFFHFYVKKGKKDFNGKLKRLFNEKFSWFTFWGCFSLRILSIH